MTPAPIRSTRFTLEPLSLKHADAIYAIRSLPEIYIWTLMGRWKSREDSINWVTTSLAVPRSLQFVVSLDLSSPLAAEIDTTALTIVDGAAIVGALGSVRDGELGYMLHPAVWGKKIAPEALRAYIPAYFEAIEERDKLTAFTDSLNPRSRRVLEKIGFTWVGSEPYDSVEMGARVGDQWEITRDTVKTWEAESI